MSVGPNNDAAFIDYLREQTINRLFRDLNVSVNTGTTANTTEDTAANAVPWNKQLQPERATALSRFRRKVDIPSITTHPIAHTIFSARCEVTDSETCLPASTLAMSSSGSCLALSAAGVHKLGRPVTAYWLPNPDGSMEEKYAQTGLGYAVHYNVIDDTRKLIFYADKHRVKSFHWDAGKPVHTMRSGICKGPISVLSGDRLARAGKGYAAIWNLDTLETHGDLGNGKIGKGKYRLPGNSWEVPEDIEPSTGSVAHATVKFADPKFDPVVWHLHKPTSYMLCAEHQKESEYDVTSRSGFVSFDLATGKTVSRYSGITCNIPVFSTSDGDAHTFATSGVDGFARLFDIRQPLPQSHFDADRGHLECNAVALAHPDGIPILFTGGTRTESIKLWDLRSKKVVYELATGNNGAVSFAWDAQSNTLYATTASEYVDILGNHCDYRPYSPPKFKHATGTQPENQNENDNAETADNHDDYDKCWPKEAYHSEDYFGYPFDAGEHRLYRYRFKEDSNLEILPKFGDATCEGPARGGWW